MHDLYTKKYGYPLPDSKKAKLADISDEVLPKAVIDTIGPDSLDDCRAVLYLELLHFAEKRLTPATMLATWGTYDLVAAYLFIIISSPVFLDFGDARAQLEKHFQNVSHFTSVFFYLHDHLRAIHMHYSKLFA